MDPEMMKSSLQMMKDNPEMLKSMGSMMENMSPEELMEQSRMAQQNMKSFMKTSSDVKVESSSPAVVEAEVQADKADEEGEAEEEEETVVEPRPEILDAMYRAAEIMSTPFESVGKEIAPSGVTYNGFVSIPPVSLLVGNGEDDMSRQELAECWNKGSLGSTRVDRNGYERVWREIQDYYVLDLVDEAQERMKRRRDDKKVRGRPKSSSTPAASAAPTAATTTTTATPTSQQVVGASLTSEQLQQQVKNMKDEDLTQMFEEMSNMSPEQEARMKAMGVDPAMMKRSANMMKNNPLLRKAASTMLKNANPDDLLKAGQQAQEKMASMSESEREELLNKLK